MLEYYTHVSSLLQTNTLLLECTKTKKAAIIDPGLRCFSWIQETVKKRKLQLESVFLTHGHFDHVTEVHLLQKSFSLTVYMHKDDENLPLPFGWGLEKPSFHPDHFLFGGESLSLGEVPFQVIATPGHTLGSLCYYFPEEKILFSGDTLFHRTIGRIGVQDESIMWHSLKLLAKLSDDTKVVPGHGKETTIGAERELLENAQELFGS